MNKSYLLAAAALLLTAAPAAKAQKRADARGWAKCAAGLNLARFEPTNSRFKSSPEAWKGVNYRFYLLEFGTWRGRFNYRAPSREYDNVRLNQNYVGLYAPLGWLSAGHRRLGIRGWALMPFVSGGIGHTTYRPNRVVSGEKKFGTAQLYAAPGLSLQLPYVTVDARALGTYYFANKDFPDAPYQKGFTFTPTVSLQFDLLTDIFSPTMSNIASVSGYAPKSTWSSNGSTATRTTTYSHQSVDVSVMDVGPFVALTPRYTWSRYEPWRGQTMAPGLGLSLRTGMLAADVFADYGQRGVASRFETLATTEAPEPKDKTVDRHDDQFAGTRTGGRAIVRAGIDVYPAIKAAFLLFGAFGDTEGQEIKGRNGNTIVSGTSAQYDPNSRVDVGGSTSFFRIITGVGAGGYLNSRTTFLHPEQEANLDRKFAAGNPGNYILNKYTDPRLDKPGAALQAYVALEAGCASISFERTSYTGDPLAKESTVSVAWLLPTRRLHAAHLALKANPKE